MLICQNIADLHPSTESQEDFTFSTASQAYTNVEEMPTFISRHCESATLHSFMTFADPHLLQGKQFVAYNLVKQHSKATSPTPNSLWYSWYRKIILNSLLEASSASYSRFSTNWCGFF